MSFNEYGVFETSPLPENYHDEVSSKIEQTVCWSTKGLYVTRLRLLSDPGFPYWDVSYCHGRLNGKPVEVSLPFHQLPKKGMMREIIEYAIREKVYAKGIGILENISKLV